MTLKGKEYLPRSVNSAIERGAGTLAQYSSSLASTPGSVVDKKSLPLLLEPAWALSSPRAPRNPRGTILNSSRPGPCFLSRFHPLKSNILWRLSLRGNCTAVRQLKSIAFETKPDVSLPSQQLQWGRSILQGAPMSISENSNGGSR